MSIFRGWERGASQESPSEQYKPTIIPRLQVRKAPSGDPVAAKDLADYLKIDGEDENPILSGLIAAATTWAENWTGRAFMKRDLSLWLDRFDPRMILSIPMPPCVSISNVFYYLEDDTQKAWAASNFISDLVGSPARIIVRDGIVLPDPSDVRIANGWEIQYSAGYPDVSTPGDSVPQAIKEAIKSVAATLYEGRADQQSDASFKVDQMVPQGAMLMLSPFKVIKFNETRQNQNPFLG